MQVDLNIKFTTIDYIEGGISDKVKTSPYNNRNTNFWLGQQLQKWLLLLYGLDLTMSHYSSLMVLFCISSVLYHRKVENIMDAAFFQA